MADSQYRSKIIPSDKHMNLLAFSFGFIVGMLVLILCVILFYKWLRRELAKELKEK